MVNFSGDTEGGYDYVKIMGVDGAQLANLNGDGLSWNGVAGALTQWFAKRGWPVGGSC